MSAFQTLFNFRKPQLRTLAHLRLEHFQGIPVTLRQEMLALVRV
jgi:hypothetical protein